MSTKVNGVWLTPAAIKTLQGIADDGTGLIYGHSLKCLRSLEAKGLIELEVETLRLTNEGVGIVMALKNTRRRDRQPTNGKLTKPRKTAAVSIAASDYHRLRSEIEARYQADLAALDRVHAILQTIAGDAR